MTERAYLINGKVDEMKLSQSLNEKGLVLDGSNFNFPWGSIQVDHFDDRASFHLTKYKKNERNDELSIYGSVGEIYELLPIMRTCLSEQNLELKLDEGDPANWS